MRLPPVSMIMTCYRHEAYIGEAVRAALAQDYAGPLQIIISDDHSPDASWDIIQDTVGSYQGPHEVQTRRGSRNLGPNVHTALLVRKAEGGFIVRCHGDDISEPQRVSRMVQTWLSTHAVLISSNASLIDEGSVSQGAYMAPSGSREITMETIVDHGWQKPMLGATYGWEKSLFSVFGPIERSELPRGGDHLLAFRAAVLGGFQFLDEPLIRYRQHAGQQTRTIADRTQDHRVFDETLAAFNLMTRMAMFRTLLRMQRTGQDSPRIAQNRGRLVSSLMGELDEWIRKRAVLMNDGMAPTWVPREALAQGSAGWSFEPEQEQEAS